MNKTISDNKLVVFTLLIKTMLLKLDEIPHTTKKSITLFMEILNIFVFNDAIENIKISNCNVDS